MGGRGASGGASLSINGKNLYEISNNRLRFYYDNKLGFTEIGAKGTRFEGKQLTFDWLRQRDLTERLSRYNDLSVKIDNGTRAEARIKLLEKAGFEVVQSKESNEGVVGGITYYLRRRKRR